MATISDNKLGLIKKYYQSGLSVREIADKLGTPFNATFYFLRKHKIPRRTVQESNAIQFANKPLSYKIKSKLSASDEKLKVAALMLYWGEGAKRGKVVDLANSDVAMIRIFLNFLRKICGVDESRLKAYIYCYSNQNLNEIKIFWLDNTLIPAEQFSQPYIRKDFAMKAGRQMENGLIHIRYCDKKLLIYILNEIEKYKNELI
ncbi:MAG: hypothetical protein WCT26_04735 [Candidatus Buchananbacteria bacterium]|jgi:hypothetical protein